MTLSGLRVLVVEDETLVAMLLEEALAGLGCVVIGPVARMPQAVALAADQPLDAALLDINVHGEAVYPLAERLAQRGVPFAFVTGYDRSQVAEAFRDRPLLRKPFTQAVICKSLTALVAQRAPTTSP